MLTTAIERYLALRRSLGFKLHEASQILRSFGRFAATRGDTHVKSATAIDWATEASSPNARRVHLQHVVHLARFLHGEDPAHDVPPMDFFHAPKTRPLPYIYTPEQVAQIVTAAHRLRVAPPPDVCDIARSHRCDRTPRLGSAQPPTPGCQLRGRSTDPEHQVREKPPHSSTSHSC